MERLLIQNIGLLATPEGNSARRGEAQGKLRFLKNAWVLCEDGNIAAVGVGPAPKADRVLDAQGKLVTPGLVDAHTHLIFGGWRQNELGLKLHGVTYLEILARGGGILSTVRATRAATEDELCDKARAAAMAPVAAMARVVAMAPVADKVPAVTTRPRNLRRLPGGTL